MPMLDISHLRCERSPLLEVSVRRFPLDARDYSTGVHLFFSGHLLSVFQAACEECVLGEFARFHGSSSAIRLIG